MKIKRCFPKGLIVCVSLLLLFLIPTASFGATFCVSDATDLQTALTTAESNGEDNTIQIVQGTYNGNFIYASTEAYGLTVEGGYTQDCGSRTIDPANTILDGGGTDTVLALVSQGAATFSVEGLTFQNGNASTVTTGGGLYASALGNNMTSITNNTFTGNTATGSGGGVYVQNYSSSYTVTLTNNTFTNNTATNGNGGGAYVAYSHPDSIGSATLTNNTFTGNTATNGGGSYLSGGRYLSSEGVTLTNNTLTGNTAEAEGGGVWLKLNDNNNPGNLYNNIIWNNTAPEGADLYIDNTGDDPFFPVTVKLFNNDFDQSSSGTYISEPFTIDPSNLDNANPLFVGSGDYHLTASSPCINTGDNDAPDLPSTDKDGNPRIIGGTVDMGAYEFEATVYVSSDGTCGGKTPCYSTIQAAMDAAEAGNVIRILQGTFDEDIIMDHAYNLTLSGGWDSTFTTQSSNTAINSLTIAGTDGTVEVENISLQ